MRILPLGADLKATTEDGSGKCALLSSMIMRARTICPLIFKSSLNGGVVQIPGCTMVNKFGKYGQGIYLGVNTGINASDRNVVLSYFGVYSL